MSFRRNRRKNVDFACDDEYHFEKYSASFDIESGRNADFLPLPKRKRVSRLGPPRRAMSPGVLVVRNEDVQFQPSLSFRQKLLRVHRLHSISEFRIRSSRSVFRTSHESALCQPRGIKPQGILVLVNSERTCLISSTLPHFYSRNGFIPSRHYHSYVVTYLPRKVPLTPSLEEEILSVLTQGGYKLCMAKACGTLGGELVYNVVAAVAGTKLCCILF
jgi:hypothetical protein